MVKLIKWIFYLLCFAQEKLSFKGVWYEELRAIASYHAPKKNKTRFKRMEKLRSQIREFFLLIKLNVCTKFYGMNIHSTAQISWGAKLDKSYPKGVHVDSGSLVTSGTLVLTHDFCRKLRKETFIGKNCFIGANSVIMPGVKIGDNSIVGAGSVVTKDVPPGCIAAGNPARIIKSGITTSKFGQILKN